MNVPGFWNEEKRFENINFLDRYFSYTQNLSFQGGTLGCYIWHLFDQ